VSENFGKLSLVGIILGIVSFIFTSSILLAVSVIVLFDIGAFLYLKRKENEKESELTSEKKPKDKKEEVVDELVDKLFEINLKLRLTPNVSEEIVERTEKVIDMVKDLLPVVNSKEHVSELTVTVNRIPLKYLPSILNPYIQISDSERSNLEAKILDNLKALQTELEKIRTAIDQGHKDDYQRMSTLIDNLFNENNNGDF